MLTKSLQGLDYFAADGSKAFEDLAEVVTTVSVMGPGQEWEKSVRDSLKAGKMYLKGDYKVFYFSFKLRQKTVCYMRLCTLQARLLKYTNYRKGLF